MKYHARCSKCGRPLAALKEEPRQINGQVVRAKRRPGWGQVKFNTSSPDCVAEDGAGFNEYLTVRLAALQLPLCIIEEGDSLGGCYLEMLDRIESFWVEPSGKVDVD